MKTLQDQYKLILEGKGNKEFFLKQARRLFPNYFNQYTDFKSAVKVLKGKQIITEAETETTEEFDLLKMMPNLYNAKDANNIYNINFNEVLRGFYAEMCDEVNKDKTVDELQSIVTKNLAKDPMHYTKDGQFGVKGVGYTDDFPGIKQKDISGKFKSSGMEEAPKPKLVKESLKSLILENSELANEYNSEDRNSDFLIKLRADKEKPKFNLSKKKLLDKKISIQNKIIDIKNKLLLIDNKENEIKGEMELDPEVINHSEGGPRVDYYGDLLNKLDKPRQKLYDKIKSLKSELALL